MTAPENRPPSTAAHAEPPAAPQLPAAPVVTEDRPLAAPVVTEGQVPVVSAVGEGRLLTAPRVAEGRFAAGPGSTQGQVSVVPAVAEGEFAAGPGVAEGQVSVVSAVRDGRLPVVSAAAEGRLLVAPRVAEGRFAAAPAVAQGQVPAAPAVDQGQVPVAAAVLAPVQLPVAPPAFLPGQPYPHQYPYGYAPSLTTNGLAIASMVLGILWLYWIGSILALIFGYVAREQILRTGQSGDGMAVAGIVLGWVGVGTLSLFMFVGILAATPY